MPKNIVKYKDINKAIGNRICGSRIHMGLSLEQLAERIGITYQQIHKYEKGTNNIPLGRLIEIAKVLEKPINYFIGELQENIDVPSEHRIMCIEVARNFMRIKNHDHQIAINSITRLLAER